MNLEEIRRRSSTVHALEALHLCRLLHVSPFSEKYGHEMFVVPFRIIVFDVVHTFIL